MRNYYWVRTLLQIVPSLLIISFVVFVLIHITGDPVTIMLSDTATDEDRERLIAALGLNEPLHVQYASYMSSLLQGDFGTSFRYKEPAMPIVLDKLPDTLLLAGASMAVALVIAIPLGILSAIKRNTMLDVLISGFSVLGKAMPNFWVGIMLVLLLSVTLGWFPVSGSGSLGHLVLPAITLGTGIAADMTRMLRSSLLEILNQDFIRTARSKGLSEAVVLNKHALRNALLPVVTVTTLQLTNLVGGAIVTETVFAWPGLGQLIVQAVNARDMAIVQSAVFVIALLIIVINLTTDLLYRLLDPRIKYE